jgi:hypothetical protein
MECSICDNVWLKFWVTLRHSYKIWNECCAVMWFQMLYWALEFWCNSKIWWVNYFSPNTYSITIVLCWLMIIICGERCNQRLLPLDWHIYCHCCNNHNITQCKMNQSTTASKQYFAEICTIWPARPQPGKFDCPIIQCLVYSTKQLLNTFPIPQKCHWYPSLPGTTLRNSKSKINTSFTWKWQRNTPI